jgi:hypothetical protein
MTEIKYYCTECDGRTCSLTSSKLPKQDPTTCPWSNVIGDFVYASWAARRGPADIPKSKKEGKSDG